MLNNFSQLLIVSCAMILNNMRTHPQLRLMKKRITHLAAILFVASASAAQAGCYADYKAKKDNPLQLHYGVIQVPQSVCDGQVNAAASIAPRLANQGWTLLNVLSVFNDQGLAGRKASAGRYFLSF